MVSWIKTVFVGLIIAVVGAVVAIIGKTNTPDFSLIGSGIGAVGIILIILGIVTKIRYGLNVK